MSIEVIASRNGYEQGIERLVTRIGHYATMGIDAVVHGSTNLFMRNHIEPRMPTRPSHSSITGLLEPRISAVYASRSDDLVTAVWHASVLPLATSYEAGRRLDISDEGQPHFTYMANQSLINKLTVGEPTVGAIYLLDPDGFIPSPYNGIDVINEQGTVILDPEPVLVTHHDLGFDLQSLAPVRLTQD